MSPFALQSLFLVVRIPPADHRSWEKGPKWGWRPSTWTPPPSPSAIPRMGSGIALWQTFSCLIFPLDPRERKAKILWQSWTDLYRSHGSRYCMYRSGVQFVSGEIFFFVLVIARSLSLDIYAMFQLWSKPNLHCCSAPSWTHAWSLFNVH